MTAPTGPYVQNELITVENYSMEEMWGRFVAPGSKEYYTYDELFADFVPSWAVFEGVPIDDAFAFLAQTETMGLWTMSMRNLKLVRDDIYTGDEAATPTGKVFVRTIADEKAMTIEWQAGHADPDDLWIFYNGILTDAGPTLGRPGTAFLWTNFVPERIKADPMVAIGFKMMYSAHRIEINNLKIILEERYGA